MASDKEYKKAIGSIVTDCTPLEAPKDPHTRVPYLLYSLLASSEESEEMERKYLQGGYGDGHAKAELLRKMIEVFGPMRDRYATLLNDPCTGAPDFMVARVQDIVNTMRTAVGM